MEEIYGYDDDDVNYWADDADDENALTFSTEKATLSGVGDAFGDLTVEQVAVDYRFPVAYVADVITGFGVQPPISDAAVIRDLLDADQAFALLEAVTSLDASEVDDAYVSFGLDGCARRLEADLAEVFALCVDNNFALPHGVETRLRRDQFDTIARTLGWRADERDCRSNTRTSATRSSRRRRSRSTPTRGRCRTTCRRPTTLPPGWACIFGSYHFTDLASNDKVESSEMKCAQSVFVVA